jgi:hypothetical protein
MRRTVLEDLIFNVKFMTFQCGAALYLQSSRRLTERVGGAATIQACIRAVPDSTIGQDTQSRLRFFSVVNLLRQMMRY